MAHLCLLTLHPKLVHSLRVVDSPFHNWTLALRLPRHLHLDAPFGVFQVFFPIRRLTTAWHQLQYGCCLMELAHSNKVVNLSILQYIAALIIDLQLTAIESAVSLMHLFLLHVPEKTIEMYFGHHIFFLLDWRHAWIFRKVWIQPKIICNLKCVELYYVSNWLHVVDPFEPHHKILGRLDYLCNTELEVRSHHDGLGIRLLAYNA